MNVAVAPCDEADLATLVDVSSLAVKVVTVLRSKVPVPIFSVAEAIVLNVSVPENALASNKVLILFILIVYVVVLSQEQKLVTCTFDIYPDVVVVEHVTDDSVPDVTFPHDIVLPRVKYELRTKTQFKIICG